MQKYPCVFLHFMFNWKHKQISPSGQGKQTNVKATQSTQAHKAPKTIEIKLLAPYALIVVVAVAIAGIITGWTLKVNDMARVQAEAHDMVTSLSKDQSR